MTNAQTHADCSTRPGIGLPSRGCPLSGSIPTDARRIARGGLQPFGQSRMLPAAAYTSPEVLAWEQRHLFAGDLDLPRARATTCCADPGPGTAHAALRGRRRRAACVLTWSGDGGARCSPTPAGTAATSCSAPTSGTSTAVDRLPVPRVDLRPRGDADRRRPGSATTRRSTRASTHWSSCRCGAGRAGCSPTRCTPLGSDGVPSFEAHLGELGPAARAVRRRALVLADRHTYEVAANWKVIAENYHECYHCPLIHPELCEVTPPDSGENYDMPGAWVGGSMDLRDGHGDHVDDRRARGDAAARRRPDARWSTSHLLPQPAVSAHPDYVMTHRMVPLAPGPDLGRVLLAGRRPPPTGRCRPPSDAVEFWDITNRQDWAACESVQRGLASPALPPGPFAPSEDAVAPVRHDGRWRVPRPAAARARTLERVANSAERVQKSGAQTGRATHPKGVNAPRRCVDRLGVGASRGAHTPGLSTGRSCPATGHSRPVAARRGRAAASRASGAPQPARRPPSR